MLSSALIAWETFMCAYRLFLKLFFGFKGVQSYLWKCHVFFHFEELRWSWRWPEWSQAAAAALKSWELTPTSSSVGQSCSPGWVWGTHRQCLAVPRSVSICRKEWFGGGGVRGEGRGGSQQKLTSYELFPLQPISGHSLLTYVFPFTLQYVCQRAIAPLTPTLLFMPSLFAHFNPVPSITAHPSPSLSSISDSYFLICLGFLPFGFFPPLPPSLWIPHHLFPPLDCSLPSFLFILSLVLFSFGHSGIKAIFTWKKMHFLGSYLCLWFNFIIYEVLGA